MKSVFTEDTILKDGKERDVVRCAVKAKYFLLCIKIFYYGYRLGDVLVGFLVFNTRGGGGDVGTGLANFIKCLLKWCWCHNHTSLEAKLRRICICDSLMPTLRAFTFHICLSGFKVTFI